MSRGEPPMMRFALKRIESFAPAAGNGSITEASGWLHISQPSTSAAMSGIENAFFLLGGDWTLTQRRSSVS
jgi:hypothetical protein